MTHAITRRGALAGAAASAAATGLGLGEAAARAPFAVNQAPYFYRFPVGKFQASIVSDGPLALGDPSGTFNGITKPEIAKALADNFLATDNVILEQNVIVLNTGTRLVMFDTGMGTAKDFGTTTGRLLTSLREAGINPLRIDDIICSHAHIDHIGGIADKRGRRYFPNATIHIAKSDFDFWTDPAKLTGDLKVFVAHARQNLLPYAKQMKFFEDGKEVVPGVQAMAAPGHTVGHTVFIITSDGRSLAYIADTTHHQILLTERPRTEFAYDTDPKQAVQSRLRVLDMLASQKIPLLAYHFPWPGTGYLAKQGDGYRYFPTAMEIVKVPPPKKA